MWKSKFSETQIVAMLKDAESGVPIADLTRKHGVSLGSDRAADSNWRPACAKASVTLQVSNLRVVLHRL